jgi:hypothetical protein
MQRVPKSSCSQNTFTIIPLGLSSNYVPEILTNLAPKGISTIIVRVDKMSEYTQMALKLLLSCTCYSKNTETAALASSACLTIFKENFFQCCKTPLDV